MTRFHRVFFPALVAVAGALPAGAYAAEEIVVSAQRRDANVQEVPISVSAFSADDLGRLDLEFVSDIGKNVPNLQTYTVTAGAAAMQVFMRGAGVQNPGFNASEAPVGIYIDDVYRGRVGTANLELADIERIEVLRGPQGTLYGRNTIAGAIKVITRTPEEDTYANASVGVGNFDTQKVTGAIGGEIADGLGASIAGLYNKRGDGWIDRGSAGGRDLGEFDNLALRGKLNWFGGDVFSAVVSLEYVDAENDGYNGIPYGPSFNPPSTPGAPLEGFYTSPVVDSNVGFGNTKQANGAVELAWALDAVTFKSITSFSQIKDNFKFDLNGGAAQAGPGLVLTGVPGFYIRSLSDNRTFTQEFSFSGGSDSFDWIAGVFFLKERGDQDYRASLDAFGLNLLEVQQTNTQSYAVFGEGTWSVTDKLSITAGARWTLDDKEYLNTCTGTLCNSGDTPPVPGPWQNDLGRNFNEFTPRLLLQYQTTENTMLFASLSRGFQAGGFQTLCFGNQSCNRVIYEPQTVVSWEAGVKTDLFDDTVRINASTFYAQYSNLQQTAIDTSSGSFPVQNVGGTDVSGLEVEASWTPVEGLQFWTILGIANEDFDSGTQAQLDAPLPPGQKLGSARRLPGLPRTTVRLGVDYRAPVFPGWDVVAGVDVDYADDYFATINNALLIDNYARWNGRFGMEQSDGNWSVILSGSNLGDSEDNFSGIAGNGTNIRTPQPPREYMLTLNYRY